MTTRTQAAAVLVAATIALSGCAPGPASVPAPTDTASHGDHDHGDHDVIVPSPTSTPDLDAAATAAVDALKAYAQRDLDYPTWFEQLKPHLHSTAIEAYSTVQPSRIPAMTIQDGAEAAPTSTDVYAVVYVPTSVGEYTIELRRDDPSAEWGVTRFQPSN